MGGVTCSGTIQQYAYDFARYDIFGALLIVFGVFLIERFSSTLYRLLVYIFFSFTSVLIHEAFLLCVTPCLLFAFIFLEKDFSFYSVLFIASLPTIFTLYVGTSQPSGSDSISSFISAMSTSASFNLSSGAARPLYWSLQESIDQSVERLIGLRDVLKSLFDIMVAVFWFSFVLYPLLHSLRKISTKIETIILYYISFFSCACFGPSPFIY